MCQFVMVSWEACLIRGREKVAVGAKNKWFDVILFPWPSTKEKICSEPCISLTSAKWWRDEISVSESIWRRRCYVISCRTLSSASAGKGGHSVCALFSGVKRELRLPSEIVLFFFFFFG